MGNGRTVELLTKRTTVVCELEALGNMGREATAQQLARLVFLARRRGIGDEEIGIAITRGCIRRCMNGGGGEEVAPTLKFLGIKPELVLRAAATILRDYDGGCRK